MTLPDVLDDHGRSRRPSELRRLTFDDVVDAGGSMLVRGYARIVPIESVQPGDEQVFAARAPRPAIGPLIDLDVLAQYPTVRSVVASTSVRTARALPSVSELLLTGVLSCPLPDPETLANLPALETLWATWALRTHRLILGNDQAARLRRLGIARYLLPGDNPIGSLSAYVGLRQLELKDCLRTESVAPLAALTELTRLSADAGGGWNQLAACSQLESVSAFRPRIKDLRRLNTWRRLHHLVLSMGPMETLDGMEAFENLESLALRALRIDSVAQLAGLGNLRDVYLQYLGNLHDISPVAALPSLRKLLVEGQAGARGAVRIGSLRALGESTHLEELTLRYVELDDGDLSPLIGLAALRKVDLPASLASAGLALQAARPDLSLSVVGGQHRARAIAVGQIDINPPNKPGRRWSIYQDLSVLLGVESNPEAERRVWAALARRSDGLLDRMTFDTEADAVGILADNEADIRAVADVIAELAIR
jgi:hypothetical protein